MKIGLVLLSALVVAVSAAATEERDDPCSICGANTICSKGPDDRVMCRCKSFYIGNPLQVLKKSLHWHYTVAILLMH